MIFKKKKLEVEDKAEKSHQALESEIEELRKFQKLFCPLIPYGFMTNIHNEPLHVAITERIEILKQRQNDLKI